METLLQDIRYGARRLARSPGFTTVAILTLALGIGANTAIFSVVHGVLLRSLPFQDPDRLVMLYTGYPEDEIKYPLSAPDFMSYHDDARSFTNVAAVVPTDQTLLGSDEPIRVAVGLVTEDFFEVMGVQPILGRGLHREENRPDANTSMILTHAFWRQQFGGDPSVIGRDLSLNGITRTVVGVLPPEFDLPDDRQIYYPLAYGSSFNSTTAEARRSEYLQVIARLRPGVSIEQARAEVHGISDRLQQEFPQTNSANINLSLVPLTDHMLGDVRTPLLLLLGAVGLVLIIACVNVANLLLARATARETELAVRTALGAGRKRLIRQLLTESVLLGLAGGAAGLLLAVWGTDALTAASPQGIPRLDEIGVDGTVVAFATVVALGTGLLFGLIPAIQITRADLGSTLREGARGSGSGRAANRARRTLVVSEMALAVTLLVGAGLLIRSFAALTSVDPGFRTERLVTFELSPPASSYPSDRIAPFYVDVLDRMSRLPGVEAVAAATEMPLMGTGSIFGFDIENQPPPPPGFVQDAAVTSATAGYFETVGIPLRRGRLFTDQDRPGAPEVLVINEAFARRYFPDEDAVGRRLSFDGDSWAEVVGVVGDAPQYDLAREVRPAIFGTHAQFTTRAMTIIARTTGDPLSLTGAIRAEMSAIDPTLPIERFTTGEQLVADAVAQPRFYMLLLTIFAAVALTLAAVGIFGVMSYLVAQRTREIGLRIALGADPGSVLRLVVSGALALAVLGVGLGIVAALIGSRLMAGLLFGIGAVDPLTYIGAAGVLLGVAGIASYLPARAATRVDPNVALRYE
jgi:putative ABC transport system permease protein